MSRLIYCGKSKHLIMTLALGTIIRLKSHSKSMTEYDKYSQIFKELVCPCKISINVRLELVEELTNVSYLAKIVDTDYFTIIHKDDISKLTDVD